MSKEGTWSPEQRFCERSDSDDRFKIEAPGEGVACDASQEVGKLKRPKHDAMWTWCQWCFPSEDGFGDTRDVCAECWTVLNDGDRSIRSMKKEQSQRRKRRGLEIQPFGDCWIEQALRWKDIEATKEFQEGLEEKKGVGGTGRSSGHCGSRMRCARTLPP